MKIQPPKKEKRKKEKEGEAEVLKSKLHLIHGSIKAKDTALQ